MDYTAPSGSTDPNAGYVGKTASTQGSKVPPRAAEFPQREIVAAEKGAGLTPSNGDLTQLLQAISRGIWLGVLGGTANAPSGVLGGGATPVVIPALLRGMRVRGVAAATATGAVTLSIVGVGGASPVNFPVLRGDGSATRAGDLKQGQIYTFEADGNGNLLIGSTTAEVSNVLAARRFVGSNHKTYSAPGNYTWTVPDTVTQIRVRAWSGGGGGGAGSSSASGGSGGGGGVHGDETYDVTPGQVLSIIVGAGGAPGVASASAPTAGGTGGTTSVGALMTLTGGRGGQAGNGGTATQLSDTGTAAGASLVVPGYFGGLAYTISGVVMGGSGGAAFGTSGPPVNVAPSNGNPGMSPGGGATGAAGFAAGGPGGAGLVVIDY
ncbi:glycine-rich domain-containing protein [Methylobacterium fujisawaense]|uniref:glycine-rich domain-containing protein n=1 Tax=Methylobacterium fujisawaense TaxID=107400 RepID=UPI00313C5380